jgi:uncharacterized C2H2 Zn-finger protein
MSSSQPKKGQSPKGKPPKHPKSKAATPTRPPQLPRSKYATPTRPQSPVTRSQSVAPSLPVAPLLPAPAPVTTSQALPSDSQQPVVTSVAETPVQRDKGYQQAINEVLGHLVECSHVVVGQLEVYTTGPRQNALVKVSEKLRIATAQAVLARGVEIPVEEPASKKPKKKGQGKSKDSEQPQNPTSPPHFVQKDPKVWKYACACGERFQKTNDLRDHKRLTHEGLGQYKCEEKDANGVECGKMYDHKKTLLKHVAVDHHKKTRYECDKQLPDGTICTFKHQDVRYYNAHLSKDHGVKGLGKRCPKCKEKFHNLHYYAKHINKCGEKPTFKCYVCEKIYKTESHYLKHIEQHADASTKPTCEKCGKQFASKNGLMKHLEKCGQQAGPSDQ